MTRTATIPTTITILKDTSNTNATTPAAMPTGIAVSAVSTSHAIPSTIQSRVDPL